VLADLVGHRPLVALLARLGAEEDLLAARGALRPAALPLAPVEADDHAQVALGDADRIDRRRRHAGRLQQLLDHAIDGFVDLFARQLFGHDGLPAPDLRQDSAARRPATRLAARGGISSLDTTYASVRG